MALLGRERSKPDQRRSIAAAFEYASDLWHPETRRKRLEFSVRWTYWRSAFGSTNLFQKPFDIRPTRRVNHQCFHHSPHSSEGLSQTELSLHLGP